jgi:hypothetical protein
MYGGFRQRGPVIDLLGSGHAPPVIPTKEGSHASVHRCKSPLDPLFLELMILICRDEHFKSTLYGAPQKLPIAHTGPAGLLDSSYIMADKVADQATGKLFVKQDAHGPLSISCAASSAAIVC